MVSALLVLLVLILSGMSGVMAEQAATSKTALEKLNDDSITAAVQGKLAADNLQNMNVVAFSEVDVQTERGIVILSGAVRTLEHKTRAEQLAGQVNGVQRVTNNLEVRASNQK
ncbi:MAG: BON domain-containing protein [Nitrospira sp.]|nr:BON domain-containing protein [Nitrospira sp.]